MPDQVRRFILTSVSSVPQLEAILLLRSAHSEAWSAARVAQRLYIREADAASLLKSLEEIGIANRTDEGCFAYAPHGELRDLLDLVAESYAVDLVGVTQLIHSRIDKRARQFADAFLIKKQGSEK